MLFGLPNETRFSVAQLVKATFPDSYAVQNLTVGRAKSPVTTVVVTGRERGHGISGLFVSKLEADTRIRTADLLFTKQLLYH